ncbi:MULTISPECIES: gamma-glutamylcyclotransferase [Modicisalibacter]|uniref:glutathione-specific gamma-glutamylcyclotransferase n=1 Tax=Modicisalibacter tunisiensis TaxID=390637 RepID=A0ABS7WXH4_9GAMM|nr:MULTISPECIES: gamma-glutamylcyclotransferase [Modicisalibacter]KXS37521.1 MAG: ChaC-like protein [Halomonadaceae bacterium T82-2]MBZ9539550.1 gamma-glutamylcyclotransferase [Modicisalibacter tunisiensis]MBZ9567045.1 gamma-glutamylcyclotransferase [Modicisalibacter tunisiensis]
MTLDTTALNRRMTHFDQHDSVWLFGYGSLIWKAGFPYRERRPASIRGWTRRFWQASHDHRGTPEAPGRVATLVAEAGAVCHGMAYRITPDVFAPLDVREKNGYLRVITELTFADGGQDTGVVYIAGEDNAAFAGPAPESEIARRIAASHGPSGANRDYLLKLAEALRELGVDDPHVFTLERELLALLRDRPGRADGA